MKLVKSLLLGSVAGLAAVAGAQAADLPAKKAAACRIRSRLLHLRRRLLLHPRHRNLPPRRRPCSRRLSATLSRVDRAQRRDRLPRSWPHPARRSYGHRLRPAPLVRPLRDHPYAGVRRIGNDRRSIATSPNVAQAFIQFGGLTAGRVTSFFSNGDLPTGHLGTLRSRRRAGRRLFAYTFSFGNGFSATLSLEDGLERRNSNFVAGAAFTAPIAYGGQRAPDVVANLKYAGTWGSAQLSGAVHQIRSATS